MSAPRLAGQSPASDVIDLIRANPLEYGAVFLLDMIPENRLRVFDGRFWSSGAIKSLDSARHERDDKARLENIGAIKVVYQSRNITLTPLCTGQNLLQRR